MKTILAIDQGTTGTKAILVDENLKVLSESYHEFEQIFPKPGWVEHDPNAIWKSVVSSIKGAIKGQNPKLISAIGITNQRETLCFWDQKTGETLGNAIVWQDRRTHPICEAMKGKNLESKFQKRTGLLLDPYFSATKAQWAIENRDEVRKSAKNKTLALGTVDSFLVWKLSGKKAHVTEPSNASRTLCFDLLGQTFDAELCQEFGLESSFWPQVQPSFGEFAQTQALSETGLPDGIPITGILGDQQAALLGQACFEVGSAKCTYGTGSFVLLNTGEKLTPSTHRLLTTVAWMDPNRKVTYALEGSSFIAGAAVQWIRDGLKLISKSEEIEALAQTVDHSDGVVFVPALTGLGAPHWDAQATGMFTGLTRGTNQGHLARAVLEGIAFLISDVLTAMQKDLGKPLDHLKVDGGACANNLLMQFQSDLLNCSLLRPQFRETTSLGAIFAAGLGAGIWKDQKELQKTWKKDREFNPSLSDAKRNEHLMRWNQAVQKALLRT